MKLEQSFTVAAPVDQVWDALVDIERIATCLPGAEITGQGPDGSYEGNFTVKLGPTTASYRGSLKMDSLDKASQDALMKCAHEAEERGWKTSEEKNAFYLEQFKKNGMTVAAPSAQLKSDFQKIGATMTEEWLKTAGADGKAIVDAYKK